MTCCPLSKRGLFVQAYKGRGEEYKLFWPKQPEFVRMAARFGATIVPFGGVGLDDGFDMLLEPKQIRAIPVLGKLLEDNAKKRIPPARRCTHLHAPARAKLIMSWKAILLLLLLLLLLICHAPNHHCRFGASCFIPAGIRDAAWAELTLSIRGMLEKL